MPGYLGIISAFCSSLVAAVLFFRHSLKPLPPGQRVTPAAYIFYHIHVFTLLFSGLYLLYALLSHNFAYHYVYAHTSTGMPVKYLVSAFWAGQEGTFLLWAICAALIGYILIEREFKLRAPVLFFLLAGQVFLCLFLILDNPFAPVPGPPPDGAGLNPLLMDPWMVVHPPVVFIGYALLAIPCCYALASLWKGDYKSGFMRCMPWALCGWLFLGSGIIVGGAWAYRVLGWGGYWGWDPVENASLVPWLTAGALVHGLLARRGKGGAGAVNLVLAILTYVLVILATFITRSGIMADFSVHAFAETALTHYMLIFLLFYLLSGTALLVWRFPDLRRAAAAPAPGLSRGNAFRLLTAVLSLLALLVLAGTVSPFITGLFGESAYVDEYYFVSTGALPALLLFLLIAVCPLLPVKGGTGAIIRQLRLPLVFAVAASALAAAVGVRSAWAVVFIAVLTMALAANARVFYSAVRRGWRRSGGYLAHLGLVLAFIGIVVSTAQTRSQVLFLEKGIPGEALGYKFEYLGFRSEEGKNKVPVMVEGRNDSFLAEPLYYPAVGRLMREPFIKRSFLKDLYLSPLELQHLGESEVLVFAKGEYAVWKNYRILFRDFRMAVDEDGRVVVGVVLDVVGEEDAVSVIPVLRQAEGEWVSEPHSLSGGEQVALDAVDASRGLARIILSGDESGEQIETLVMEVKIKPLISLLAAGAVLLVAGSGLAAWCRFTE